MRAEFKEYLEVLRVPENVQDKAKERLEDLELLLDTAQGSAASGDAHLYIGNYVERKGVEGYDSLWLFRGGLVAEARNFWLDEYYRIVPLTAALTAVEVRKKGVNLAGVRRGAQGPEPSDESRMQVTLQTSPDVRCELNAARGNCLYLAHLLVEVILPLARLDVATSSLRQAGVY